MENTQNANAPEATTPTETVWQTIMAVMREVRAVGKDGHNKQQGFSFRGIDGVMNAVGPAMRNHGLMIMPEEVEREMTRGQSKTGGVLTSVHLMVTYRLTNSHGDSCKTRVPAEAFDSSDKATAKAMSVALRTALLQVLALPTQDRDPDEDYHELASAPAPGQAPQAQHAPQFPPVPADWERHVEAAEQAGDVGKLRAMEQSAQAHGQYEARTAIAAARMRVKNAGARPEQGTPTPDYEG